MQNELKGRSDGGRGGEGGTSVGECAAKTRNDRPCRGLVRPGSDYCPAHDPARADARRKAASKAARSKPGGESGALKEQLKKLAEDILAKRVEPKAGAVVTQIANVYTRLLEFEKRFKEQEEFEARIAAIEERFEEEEEFEAQIAAIEEKRRIWKSQNT